MDMRDTNVVIDNISDYQIFQQHDGYADITVTGYVYMPEACGRERGCVELAIIREYNGTYVKEWEKAEMDGDRFTHTFKDVPAGGLYRIMSIYAAGFGIDDGVHGDVCFHIGVGDLYVITGQSNSSGYGKTPACDEPESGVHLYRNSCEWDLASHPLNDSTRTKHPVNTEFANSGTSPYLSFAKALKRELNYPIGLIQTSLGGSSLDAWHKVNDGCLYRNMIETVQKVGGDVKGILWYQGCTDADPSVANGPETYLKRFTEFVGFTRADLGLPELPFFTVQLNKFVLADSSAFDERWGKVREAQRQAALTIPGVYITSTLDLPMSDAIHNNSAANVTLGERMAYQALEVLYGKAYRFTPPDIDKAVMYNDTVAVLYYKNVTQHLMDYALPVSRLDFVFRDEKGVIPISAAHSNHERMVFTLSRKPEGDATVSFSPCCYPMSMPPFDRGTGLPILAFDRVKIQWP